MGVFKAGLNNPFEPGKAFTLKEYSRWFLDRTRKPGVVSKALVTIASGALGGCALGYVAAKVLYGSDEDLPERKEVEQEKW